MTDRTWESDMGNRLVTSPRTFDALRKDHSIISSAAASSIGGASSPKVFRRPQQDLLELDVGRPDHIAPLLLLAGDQLGEISR